MPQTTSQILSDVIRYARLYFISSILFICGYSNSAAIDQKFLAELQVKPSNEIPTVDESAEVASTTTSTTSPATSSAITPADHTSTGKKLSIVTIRPIETLQQGGIHDLENNAVVTLQEPRAAMAEFPLDRREQVNWVETLDAGLIQPRADLKGEGGMLVMDMDIIMKNTQFMPYVRFPHLAHTKWLDCSNCHPKIFIPQEHANPISMNKVLRGQYCGVCHDKVAFALFVCERCHSVPHKGSGKKWW